jgi:hypothetical protein
MSYSVLVFPLSYKERDWGEEVSFTKKNGFK